MYKNEFSREFLTTPLKSVFAKNIGKYLSGNRQGSHFTCRTNFPDFSRQSLNTETQKKKRKLLRTNCSCNCRSPPSR